MTTRFWIKLYIEMLDEPNMARLPNHLWRRAVELFLLAGREGNDGALPPVEEMAWKLRLSDDKLLEDLQGLAEAGVVHMKEAGKWSVRNFSKWQTAVPVEERVRQYRERRAGVVNDQSVVNGQSTAIDHSSAYGLVEAKGLSVTKRYKRCNDGGEEDSNSTSPSDSESVKEGVQREREAFDLPRTPREAMEHPDVQVFSDVIGGRIPGLAQYQAVIEAVRLIRKREKLDEAGLREYLAPFWLAWSSRKRLDGRPYDRGNISWLVEWALNGTCPVQGGPMAEEPKRAAVASPDETRRMLAEKEAKLKQAVTMPEEVREKMRNLARQKAGKEAP